MGGSGDGSAAVYKRLFTYKIDDMEGIFLLHLFRFAFVELTFTLAPFLTEDLVVVSDLTGELCAFIPFVCIYANLAQCSKPVFLTLQYIWGFGPFGQSTFEPLNINFLRMKTIDVTIQINALVCRLGAEGDVGHKLSYEQSDNNK